MNNSVHCASLVSTGMRFPKGGQDQPHLVYRGSKKAKESTNKDDKQIYLCERICAHHLKTVLLAVTAFLLLCGFTAASEEGIPQPLSEGHKYAIMIKINELRAKKRAVRMDCIRFWNHTLEDYAQSLANKCHSVAPREPKYPVAISAAENEQLENAFTAIDEIGKWYNEKTQRCNIIGPEYYSTKQCQNFRQFYRYEGHEVGCAMSKCQTVTPQSLPNGQGNNGSILWVCAFTSRAPSRKNPYAPLRGNVEPCKQCSSDKSMCNSSTSNLCCDAGMYDLVIPTKPVASAGIPPVEHSFHCPTKNCSTPFYSPSDSPLSVSSTTESNLPPASLRRNVYLYKDRILGETFVTFDGLPDTPPVDISQDRTRYIRTGPIGSVVKLRAKFPACQQLKPIHHLYSPVMIESIYTADVRQIRTLQKQGYEDKGAAP
uniref:SCP domain-containing protein n=1 Tax=Trichuris muris TaxID=70415 RepID=A0A5S6QSC0_TRIMR